MLEAHYHDHLTEAGCDEAGRGCLAGSVFAAAVIFPHDYRNKLLNDSKQLSEKKRLQLRERIIEDALAWAVSVVSPEEIDQINILNASILAMHRALDGLSLRPEAVIVDGNRFKPYRTPLFPNDDRPTENGRNIVSHTWEGQRAQDALPYATIVKGDARYLSIAAASILAKTFRDDYMNRLALEYPFYDWKNNKGYPTKAHREAISRHGVTPYHRQSFRLLGDPQLSFDFGD